MTVDIRPLSAEDMPGFHAVIDRVARERRYIALFQAPALEDFTAFHTAARDRGCTQIVAHSDGHVVGWCDIINAGREISAHCGTLGMGLLPEVRGRGIGRRLIVAALEDAWQRGFTRVQLSVYTDNHPARALYASVGFQSEGTQIAACRIDGRYRDLEMMAIVRVQ